MKMISETPPNVPYQDFLGSWRGVIPINVKKSFLILGTAHMTTCHIEMYSTAWGHAKILQVGDLVVRGTPLKIFPFSPLYHNPQTSLYEDPKYQMPDKSEMISRAGLLVNQMSVLELQIKNNFPLVLRLENLWYEDCHMTVKIHFREIHGADQSNKNPVISDN